MRVRVGSGYLPVEPLLRAVPRFTYAATPYGSMGGVRAVLPKHLERAYHRARAAGRLTYAAADELAIALGYHPSEIWPEWFDVEVSA